eukprot:GEMP01022685.1.p1 GENE.GEMP01022685.1~~GEMP01022685.1.p1  ORF type:complete len:503 (+),score=127.83 GEMP01022685.1:141-1649(+)
MNVDALLAFADEDGLLREDVLRRGGPAIVRRLESSLGPGPWGVKQIENLLRGVNGEMACGDHFGDFGDAYCPKQNRERLSYRTAEYEQLLRLIDGMDDEGLTLDEQDIDFILQRQEEQVLQVLQPLFSNFVDESTVSAGPDQPHFKEMSHLVHDLFDVLGKMCRKVRALPKAEETLCRANSTSCTSCRSKDDRLEEIEHSLAEVTAEVKSQSIVANDLSRQLSAKHQELGELRSQCIFTSTENSSLTKSQRGLLVQKQLDLATQIQLHTQACRLSDANVELSREATARAQNLEEKLSFWQQEVVKYQQENQHCKNLLQTREEVNLILTRELGELESFASAKTETIAELEQLLEEERAGAAKLARISNDEQKNAELRKCQEALRQQEQRNAELITDLKQLVKVKHKRPSEAKEKSERKTSLGSIQDLARVLAPPMQKKEEKHAVVDSTMVLQKIIQNLTAELADKSKEVEELRMEAFSWGRSWGSTRESVSSTDCSSRAKGYT